MTLASPEEMPHAFAGAWMDRDATRLAALFAGNADFVNVVGIWWEDRASIEKAHGYALGSFFAETRLAVGRVKTRALGPDHTLVHARIRLTGQLAPNGTVADPRSTILSFVMGRDGDGWICLAAQNTEIVPGAETYRAAGGNLAPQDYR